MTKMKETPRKNWWTISGKMAQVEELEKQNQIKSDKIIYLHNSVLKLEKLLAEATRSLKDAQKEKVQVQAQKQELELSFKKLSEENENQKSELKNLEELNKKSKSELQSVSKALEQVSAKLQENAQNPVVGDLQQQLKHLQTKIQTEQANFTTKQKDLEKQNRLARQLLHWFWLGSSLALVKSCGSAAKMALEETWEDLLDDWYKAFQGDLKAPLKDRLKWLKNLLKEARLLDDLSCKKQKDDYVFYFETGELFLDPGLPPEGETLPPFLQAFLASILVKATPEPPHLTTTLTSGARTKKRIVVHLEK